MADLPTHLPEVYPPLVKGTVKAWQELQSELQTILPKEYLYQTVNYEDLRAAKFSGSCPFALKVTIATNVSSKDGALDWKKAFEDHSYCKIVITRGRKVTGQRFSFCGYYHCQHSSETQRKNRKRILRFPDSDRNKNCQCASKISIKVAAPKVSMPRSHKSAQIVISEDEDEDDEHTTLQQKSEMNCVIEILWQHSHPLQAAHVLSFRSIDPEIKETYRMLFSRNHTASTARRE